MLDPPARRGLPFAEIVVLGGGVAGLCAAYELQSNGQHVTILEARSFPGGRVQTIRKPFDDGLYAEAGATIVPAGHSVTNKYIQLFDLPLDAVQSSGRNIHRLFFSQPSNAGLSPEQLLEKYLPEPPIDLNQEMDRISFSDYLRSRGASNADIEMIRVEYVEEWGEGIDSYSALSCLYDLAHGHAAPFYRIRGGSDRLPAAFASRLDRIVYNAVVQEIHQDTAGIQIQFENEKRIQSLNADFAVCTIPFSVLRKIRIDPPLSSAHREVVETLPYTSVSRVYMQMKERFWTAQGFSGNAYTDLSIATLFHDTVNQPGPRGILESYSCSSKARDIGAMKESDRIDFTLQQTEAIFPDASLYFEKGVSKFWDDDPWVRGGYAWFPTGQRSKILSTAPLPEGRIHFAGDHTSDLPGWMQGALSSGMRAASEILKLAR